MMVLFCWPNRRPRLSIQSDDNMLSLTLWACDWLWWLCNMAIWHHGWLSSGCWGRCAQECHCHITSPDQTETRQTGQTSRTFRIRTLPQKESTADQQGHIDQYSTVSQHREVNLHTFCIRPTLYCQSTRRFYRATLVHYTDYIELHLYYRHY